ncbi:hypothetical protein M0813_16443 [Anaeramoeba flamelloides]|uniref:Uncharacterized protein n=1 Tax=Anaeramoeba flamelloides TaxID=1746091 RepID=A0ABQ8YZY5_9EUKA|nr:hypothetical protein M0813_16443 [Anaeramoeba flamelloides]
MLTTPNQIIIRLETKTEKKTYPTTKHVSYFEEYVNSLQFSNTKNINVETTNDPEKSVLARDNFRPRNQFIWLLHLSFCDHTPLVLTPDYIWLTLLQGLSIHINNNPQKYRSQFTTSSTKESIVVENNSLVQGNLFSPWSEVFSKFSEELKERIGEETQQFLVKGFSTTTPTIENAYQIMLMDVVKSYFDYYTFSKCGIPEIRLEGTVEDWESLYDRVSKFEEYDLGWWVEKLRYVFGTIVKTVKANGEGFGDFWDSFYKWNRVSGGDRVTGWVHIFFPYDKENQINSFCKNFDFDFSKRISGFSGLKLSSFPSGMSKVPFIWEYQNNKLDMDFYSGFTGLLQEEKDNGALRTNIGWAVAYRKVEEEEEKEKKNN